MIRIFSIDYDLCLKCTMPELVIIRSIKFMGDGDNPEEYGHIIVIEKGDDLSEAFEIGPNGLCDEEESPTIPDMRATFPGVLFHLGLRSMSVPGHTSNSQFEVSGM